MKTHYQQSDGQFHCHTGLVKHVEDVPVVDKATGEFVHEPGVSHSSPTIAVAYVRLPDRMHVFTHGPEAAVREWCTVHNEKCPPEHRAEVRVFGQDTPVETINRVLDEPAFLATLV